MDNHAFATIPPTPVESQFRLPVITELAGRFGGGLSEIECSAPTIGGVLQVGFRGDPDCFNKIKIQPENGGIQVSFGMPMPIEGPVIDKSSKPKVVRHITPEIASVEFSPDESSGAWVANAVDAQGNPVEFTEEDRLVLARTFAKLGEIGLRKAKNFEIKLIPV